MTTTVHIWAFNSSFSIKITRKEYVSLEYCKQFVKRNLEYGTAQIQYIEQGDNKIYNPAYKEPFELIPVMATKHLKMA